MKLKESKGISLIVFTIILAVLVVIAGGVIVYLLNNQQSIPQTPIGEKNNFINNDGVVNKNDTDNEIETGKEEKSDSEKEDNENKEYNITRETIDINTEEGKYAFNYTCKDKNNKVIWTYKTEAGVTAQWGTIEEIANSNDRIYIYENGTIKVLNKENGKITWKNEDFKNEGILYTVFLDKNENLYIYAGTLTVIDNNGKVKAKINHEYLNGDAIGYEFLKDSYLMISGMNSEGSDKEFYIDLEDYSTITGENKNNNTNGTEYLICTKKDKNNKVVWTYKTNEYGWTELNRVEFLTIIGNKVYINEAGTVIALNENTGKIIWKNSDYEGASSCFCIDSENKLYIAGSYSPFLCIIDENGKTIKRINDFGDDYLWPVELELRENNELAIKCTILSEEDKVDNNDFSVLIVNLKDYSTKIENIKK